MSRKPRAIRLSTSKQTNVDEPLKKASDTIKLKSETKPKKAKAKPTKSSDSSPRAPRVMAAPKIDEEAYDPFDQSPFINSEDRQVVSTHLPDMNKGIKWGSIMFSAVLALMSIGFTFWAVELVEAFFARNPLLGWLTFSLSVLFVIALFALLLREFLAIRNLRRIGNLREEAEQVLLDNGSVKPVEQKLIALYSTRSDMQWHLDKLRSHDDDIMDEQDRIRLAEISLMSPLDAEAKQIIAGTAKRVSVITALNPSAVLDILFVGYQVISMLRKLMGLYGGKPAFFAALKLVRMVATHLAVTGGLAVSDTILQQFLGKGLAGTLSRKVGEGTVNGIMATRIGIAAIDLCRPLPFSSCERPNLKAFLGELLGGKLGY